MLMHEKGKDLQEPRPTYNPFSSCAKSLHIIFAACEFGKPHPNKCIGGRCINNWHQLSMTMCMQFAQLYRCNDCNTN